MSDNLDDLFGVESPEVIPEVIPINEEQSTGSKSTPRVRKNSAVQTPRNASAANGAAKKPRAATTKKSEAKKGVKKSEAKKNETKTPRHSAKTPKSIPKTPKNSEAKGPMKKAGSINTATLGAHPFGGYKNPSKNRTTGTSPIFGTDEKAFECMQENANSIVMEQMHSLKTRQQKMLEGDQRHHDELYGKDMFGTDGADTDQLFDGSATACTGLNTVINMDDVNNNTAFNDLGNNTAMNDLGNNTAMIFGDSTAMNDLGSDTALNCLGGESVINNIFDGMSTAVNIDGSSTAMNIDGSSTAMNIDGSSTAMNIDGSSTAMNIDGSSTAMNIDGSSTAMNIDGGGTTVNLNRQTSGSSKQGIKQANKGNKHTDKSSSSAQRPKQKQGSGTKRGSTGNQASSSSSGNHASSSSSSNMLVGLNLNPSKSGGGLLQQVSQQDNNGAIVVPQTPHVIETVSDRPASVVPIVHNAVASFMLKADIDVRDANRRLRNSEYNPKKGGGALIVRVKEPRATALVHENGKCTITGAKGAEEAKLAGKKVAKMFQKIFPHKDVKFANFRILNLVAVADLGFPVRLEAVASDFKSCACYEPEMFCGLVWKIWSPKMSLNIYVSGKMVITGGKTIEELYLALDEVYAKLRDYQL